MALARKAFSKVLIAAAAFACAGAAHAGTLQWTVSDASGDAVMVVSGQSRALAKGSPVLIGTAFETGRNGTVVLTRGDETVVLAPNSRLRVADPAPSRGLVQMLADRGTAVFRMKDATAPLFAVSTPYLAAAGKGAQFSVTVSDSGTQVTALEGDVQVFTHDGRSSQRVGSGMVALVRADAQDSLLVNGGATRLAEGFAPTKVALKD